jgi:hypothetical protein
MELARISAGVQDTDESVWEHAVVQSITGGGGDLIRQATGIPASDQPMDPEVVASHLAVSEHWKDQDYAMYKSIFGDQTPATLYSAMFATPLPGTEADVEKHFGTHANRRRAMCLFIAMKDNLVLPVEARPEPVVVASSSSSTMVLPTRAVPKSTNVANPVGDLIASMGLPTMTNRKHLATLLLTHYLPNKAVGVRSYLEQQLRLGDYNKPALANWVAQHPTLDSATWGVLASEVGGFSELPAELHAWLPFDVPFRQQIALAMTQENDMELVGDLFPAMGTLMARRVRAARTEIRASFPDLGAWLAQTVCS